MKIRLFSILLLFVVLSLPALRNGQVFLMSDTTTYIRGADAAVYKLTGWRTAWTGTFIERYETTPASRASPQAATTLESDPADLPVTISGRSVFYGMLLYLSCLTGSFWGAAIVQILLTAVAITLAAESICRAVARPAPGYKAAVLMAIVAGISPAGYFAAYMMPDIFLPLAIMAFCQIGLFWPILSRGERAFWIGLLTASLLFHNVHVVIVIGAFVLLALLRGPALLRKGRIASLAILMSVAVAIAGQATFASMVQRATGAAPVDVPFLTARLVADGPGRDYLAAHCPDAGFLLCRHVGRLPNDSDTFLWSRDLRFGIFSAAAPHDARRIAAEQTRFAIAVALDRPLALARSTAAAIFDQLGRWHLAEFNYSPHMDATFRAKLPEPILDRTMRSAAFTRDMPVRFTETMTLLLIIASMPIMAVGFRKTPTGETKRALLIYLAVIVGALLINAAICGGISTPHDRYQMRLIWLLPVFAVALWNAARPAREDMG